MNYQKVKFEKWEFLYLWDEGRRTGLSAETLEDGLKLFRKNKALKMVAFKSTHNNTRLKKFAEYGPEWKK